MEHVGGVRSSVKGFFYGSRWIWLILGRKCRMLDQLIVLRDDGQLQYSQMLPIGFHRRNEPQLRVPCCKVIFTLPVPDFEMQMAADCRACPADLADLFS